MKILNSNFLVIAALTLGIGISYFSSKNSPETSKNYSASLIMGDDTTDKDTTSLAFLRVDDDTVVTDTIAAFKLSLVMYDTTEKDTTTLLRLLCENYALLGDTIVEDTVAARQFFASL